MGMCQTCVLPSRCESHCRALRRAWGNNKIGGMTEGFMRHHNWLFQKFSIYFMYLGEIDSSSFRARNFDLEPCECQVGGIEVRPRTRSRMRARRP